MLNFVGDAVKSFVTPSFFGFGLFWMLRKLAATGCL